MSESLREKTCCFTGHRVIPARSLPALAKELEQTLRRLIGAGVRYFGAGGALGFDTLAAETVLRLKGEYPGIRLILVLPCRDQTRGWREADVRRYRDILSRAEGGLHRRALFSRLHAPTQPPSGGKQFRLRGLLHPRDRGQRLHGTVRPATGAAPGAAGGGGEATLLRRRPFFLIMRGNEPPRGAV